MICGLDEAGKGAVYGPLVVASATSKYSFEETTSILSKLKVRDSKLLSRAQRKQIISVIDKDPFFSINLSYLKSETIDNFVYRKGLNQLLYKTYLDLIIVDLKGNASETYYLDSFSTPAGIERRLREDIQRQLLTISKVTLIVEYKADQNYLITSLASIYAKEARENYLDQLELRSEIGSGYPSDERIKEYIRKNISEYKNKSLKEIRYSWKLKL